MDGVAMTDDDTAEEHTVDLSLCLSLILSLYFVYNVEYPTKLSNTMKYVERYIVGYSDATPVPVRVSKVHNMLSL